MDPVVLLEGPYLRSKNLNKGFKPIKIWVKLQNMKETWVPIEGYFQKVPRLIYHVKYIVSIILSKPGIEMFEPAARHLPNLPYCTLLSSDFGLFLWMIIGPGSMVLLILLRESPAELGGGDLYALHTGCINSKTSNTYSLVRAIQ